MMLFYLGKTIPRTETLIVLMNFAAGHLDAERQSTGIPFEAAVGPYTRKDG